MPRLVIGDKQSCLNIASGLTHQEFAPQYNRVKNDPEFLAELAELRKRFVGRPSPIYKCKNLSAKIGGATIYLKREDLNHTGSHKINHCLGEALLAKKMGKGKLIAETGAGQHGVALATVASLMQMDCEIHMGEVDVSANYLPIPFPSAKIVHHTFHSDS